MPFLKQGNPLKIRICSYSADKIQIFAAESCKTYFMKKLLSLLLFSLLTFPVFAQEEVLKKSTEKLARAAAAAEADSLPWKKGGMGTLTFSQVSLTNWAAGGQNSVAANAFLNLFANYKKGDASWDNNLDLAYGLVRQGVGGDYIKSDDRVELNSKYGRKAFRSDQWYYAALLNFRTQMAPGYNYPNDSVKISDFMAPAYILLALGMDYKPTENITAFISPITGRITVVNNTTLADAGNFGVKAAEYNDLGQRIRAGEKLRYEFGGYFRFSYKQDIGKSATFLTKLDLFSNYMHNPLSIDVNWETSLVVKVGKYIGVNFGTMLIYDEDVKINVDRNNDGVVDGTGPRVQFKQIFGVGFSYKF